MSQLTFNLYSIKCLLVPLVLKTASGARGNFSGNTALCQVCDTLFPSLVLAILPNSLYPQPHLLSHSGIRFWHITTWVSRWDIQRPENLKLKASHGESQRCGGGERQNSIPPKNSTPNSLPKKQNLRGLRASPSLIRIKSQSLIT